MLNAKIVHEISERKHEPSWMLEKRLRGLELFDQMKMPEWGPDISELKIDQIETYVLPKSEMKNSWDEVPADIRQTFEDLGIPEAERAGLAGVGAQYDSEMIYHNIQEETKELGVIYADLESVICGEYDTDNLKYSDMVKEKFGKIIPADAHKFAALHAAVWSGGSFVYVPKGVDVEIPLQSYFRFNEPGAGQFEHTLIIVEDEARLTFIEGCSAPKYNVANLHAGGVEIYVGKNAYVRYSTVENWSKNMYNLNTKRAWVEAGGRIEWVSGSFGSKVSYLYPMSILAGEGASADFNGISLAGEGQNLDTGAKMLHLAPNTNSNIVSKSLCQNGGKSTFRSVVKITTDAKNSKSLTNCDSLLLDELSATDTVPRQEVDTTFANVGHEARIGKISEKSIQYLMNRGMSEEAAKSFIVSGYAESVAQELPLEYAVEMTNLIELAMKGGKK